MQVQMQFRGEGAETAMLVHGSPGGPRSWARVARHLDGRFRLALPTLAGHGGVRRVAEAPAIATASHAAPLADWLREQPGPVLVAGHSYGGNVALNAARMAPEKVSRLVLFEPVLISILQTGGAMDAFLHTKAAFDRYIAAALAGEPQAVRLMIDYWFGEGGFDRMPAAVQGYMEARTLVNVRDVQASYDESYTPEDLAALPMPARIAYGTASPEATHRLATVMARLLPRGEAVPVPGGTHGMLDSHPEQVAAIIAGAAMAEPAAEGAAGAG